MCLPIDFLECMAPFEFAQELLRMFVKTCLDTLNELRVESI